MFKNSNKYAEENRNRSSGKSELLVLGGIGLLIAAAFAFFILRIIGHSEEHVEKVKKTKVLYRESLSWRPDGKLSEKRILADLRQNPNKKKAKYAQSTLTEGAMRYIGQMSKLKNLELNESKFDQEWLKYIVKLPLKTLMLNGTDIGDKGVQYVSKLKKLRILEVGDTEISDQGLAYISKCSKLNNLDLEMARNITDSGIEELTKLKQLYLLNLSYTKLTAKSFDSIAKMEKLKVLKLKGVKFATADYRKLAKIPKLKSLFLHRSDIDDNDIVEIAKIKSLRNLYISDNDFTDKGLNHISKSLNLHDLSIQDCPNLTASAISKFKKENPRCYVNSSSQARLIKEEIPIDEIREETKLFETRELLNKKSSKATSK